MNHSFDSLPDRASSDRRQPPNPFHLFPGMSSRNHDIRRSLPLTRGFSTWGAYEEVIQRSGRRVSLMEWVAICNNPKRGREEILSRFQSATTCRKTESLSLADLFFLVSTKLNLKTELTVQAESKL